jgi:glycerophosphoryl diester phosphodiesterase
MENTLAAFGVPGTNVECDVMWSKDGVLCVHHDWSLARVFGVDRRVSSMLSAELGEIGVPTLNAVLDVVLRGKNRSIIIDLKTHDTRGELRMMNAIVDLLQDFTKTQRARVILLSWQSVLSTNITPSVKVYKTSKATRMSAARAGRFKHLGYSGIAMRANRGTDMTVLVNNVVHDADLELNVYYADHSKTNELSDKVRKTKGLSFTL